MLAFQILEEKELLVPAPSEVFFSRCPTVGDYFQP